MCHILDTLYYYTIKAINLGVASLRMTGSQRFFFGFASVRTLTNIYNMFHDGICTRAIKFYLGMLRKLG